MESNAREKHDRLESTMEKFVADCNKYIDALGKSVTTLSEEMLTFKDEISNCIFDNQSLRKELRAVVQTIQEYMAESRAERRDINQKWVDLAAKMGTVVEDVVAPCIGDIARRHFQVDEFDFFALKLKKRNKERTISRDFDVVAVSHNFFFLVETKATPRPEYIQGFIDFIPSITTWFPEAAEKTIVPIFASPYLPPDSVQYLTTRHVFALAVTAQNNMELLNPEVLMEQKQT